MNGHFSVYVYVCVCMHLSDTVNVDGAVHSQCKQKIEIPAHKEFTI